MRLLVVGAGVSGRAASRLGRAQDMEVLVYDRNPDAVVGLRSAGVDTVTGEWQASFASDADAAVVSPGVPENARPIRDCLAAKVRVWSELEFASRFTDAPLIAVTGTNGKTTTTSLAADMLGRSGRKAAAVGNIGTALSDVALESWDVLVVEASSFQLRFIDRFHPVVAVVLNAAEDHLDWHGSVEAYRDAKARICENQTHSDLLVYDKDDPGARAIAANAPSRTLGISAGGLVTEGVFGAGGAQVPLDSLSISDAAYLVDFGAAAEAAAAAGATTAGITDALLAFRPQEHRRSLVTERDGVAWVDDSKATNPHAAVASIAAYPSVVLIAGGRNKGLDLSQVVAQPNLRAVIALGEAKDDLVAAAQVPVHLVSEMTEAVKAADDLARPGDTVLLAPACASFDMYASYEERGEAFSEAVLGGER